MIHSSQTRFIILISTMSMFSCDTETATISRDSQSTSSESQRVTSLNPTADPSMGESENASLDQASPHQDGVQAQIELVEQDSESSQTIAANYPRYCDELPDWPHEPGGPEHPRYAMPRFEDCCGDDLCDRSIETKNNCPEDCVRCGDNVCESWESPRNCPADCGTCGNGRCDRGETAASCQVDCGLPTRVRVDRVRRCRNKRFFCNSIESFPDYGHWEWQNVKRKHQKKTFISQISTPHPSSVKHLVFVSAGQQNNINVSWEKLIEIDDEFASHLTGQPDAYKNGFGRKDGYRWIDIRKGIAHRIFERMSWRKDESFVALALDARFNFEYKKSSKDSIVRAYFNWLSSKIKADKIESIYLAGHSRGGCLVAQLGKLFNEAFPEIPLIIQTFDPVCTRDGFMHNTMFKQAGEFGVTANRRDNPLVEDPDYFGFAVDLGQHYPNKEKVAFLNLLSGDPIIKNPDQVNAFSHADAHEAIYNSGGPRPWLEQRWTNDEHQNFGNHKHQDTALEHLERHCSAMGCN